MTCAWNMWLLSVSLLPVLPRLLTMATGVDLHARHGAILACAEVVHALYQEGVRTGR